MQSEDVLDYFQPFNPTDGCRYHLMGEVFKQSLFEELRSYLIEFTSIPMPDGRFEVKNFKGTFVEDGYWQLELKGFYYERRDRK